MARKRQRRNKSQKQIEPPQEQIEPPQEQIEPPQEQIELPQEQIEPFQKQIELFQEQDLEFRTITTLLYVLGSSGEVKLDNFTVPSKQRSQLKLLHTLSLLLVRDHEIVAILPKRSSFKYVFFVGYQDHIITRNPEDNDPDPQPNPVKLLQPETVDVGSDIKEFVVDNWGQTFDHHIQAFAALLNKALSDPSYIPRMNLRVYSLLQSAPKIYRRFIGSSLRTIVKLGGIPISPSANAVALPPLSFMERQLILTTLSGSHLKGRHPNLSNFLGSPPAWTTPSNLLEFHKYFTWLLHSVLKGLKKLKSLRSTKNFHAEEIGYLLNQMGVVTYFAWKSDFFRKYIQVVRQSSEGGKEIPNDTTNNVLPNAETRGRRSKQWSGGGDLGFPTNAENSEGEGSEMSAYSTEGEGERSERDADFTEKEGEDTDFSTEHTDFPTEHTDFPTEHETGEGQIFRAPENSQPPPSHDEWILDLRLLTSNDHHLRSLLGAGGAKLSFKAIQYSKSDENLKPWRKVIQELFEEDSDPDMAKKAVAALRENCRGTYRHNFQPDGPTLKFKGRAHCEAVLACLYTLAQDKDHTKSGWAKIPSQVLDEVKFSYNFVAPSKRCCPVCASIISYLSTIDTGSQQLYALSTHSVVFPCAFPIGLPQIVREKLLKKYKDVLADRFKTLVGRGRSSSSDSWQSDPLSDENESKRKNMDTFDIRWVIDTWKRLSHEELVCRWESVRKWLEEEEEELAQWWACIPNDMKLLIEKPEEGIIR